MNIYKSFIFITFSSAFAKVTSKGSKDTLPMLMRKGTCLKIELFKIFIISFSQFSSEKRVTKYRNSVTIIL